MEIEIFRQMFLVFFTASLSVLGGLLPLSILLYFLFHKAKNNHRLQIEFEYKLIELYRKTVANNKPAFDLVTEKMLNGSIPNGIDPTDFLKVLHESHTKAEMNIVISESYIARVKSASFVDWVSYYFTKSYFASYFSKG